MSDYYGAGNTAHEFVESGRWDGITLGAYGDNVTISDNVDVDILLAFAKTMFIRAVRAERAVETFSAAQERWSEGRLRIAEILGEKAKAAALQQDWCNEYEGWTAQIVDALQNHGFYAEAEKYRETAERRHKFSVTVEFLARNQYSAADMQYALADRMNDSNSYGCKFVTATDPTLVVESNDDNDDTSNGTLQAHNEDWHIVNDNDPDF